MKPSMQGEEMKSTELGLDAARTELKRLVFAQWRYPRVRPRQNFTTWERVPQWEQGFRAGMIALLAEMLTARDFDPRLVGFVPTTEAHNLIGDLLMEERLDKGLDPTWAPPWSLEEEEFKQRLDRGALTRQVSQQESSNV